MNEETLTLVLNGSIPLDLFARAVEQFRGLIAALSDEMADEDPIEWEINRLDSGSAIIEIRSTSADTETVDQIVRAYAEVGAALARREPVPFSPDVASCAYGLTALLNGKITAMMLQTRSTQFTVREPAAPVADLASGAGIRLAYGEVRGEITAIIRRPHVRVILYDDLFDKPVRCHLDPDWQDKVNQFWAKRVAVTGLVYRDESTDRPLRVTKVVSIDILRPAGDFRLARGVIPWQPGNEPAEATIRRLRDDPNQI